MDYALALQTNKISKRFGEFTAVNNASLEMRDKEILGVIGPNGAGKTTFLNLLTGYYIPDSGTVVAGGKDITKLSPATRASLGIARTFQLVHVFDNLTVYENVALASIRKRASGNFSIRMLMKNLRGTATEQEVQMNLELLELDHLKYELVGNLPLGSRKRLELAIAFTSDPKILMLDEPFAGLSDGEIDEVVKVIRQHRAGKSILIVEHKISKLTEFADRLAVMHEGQIIRCGTCEETLNDSEVRRCYWKVS